MQSWFSVKNKLLAKTNESIKTLFWSNCVSSTTSIFYSLTILMSQVSGSQNRCLRRCHSAIPTSVSFFQLAVRIGYLVIFVATISLMIGKSWEKRSRIKSQSKVFFSDCEPSFHVLVLSCKPRGCSKTNINGLSRDEFTTHCVKSFSVC